MTATTSCASTRAIPHGSPSGPIPAADRRIVVATLGDSITEGSPDHDSRRGGNVESQWQHWAARRDPRLEFRNYGVYGQRTDEIARRFDDCVPGADVLVVQGGINDIAQGRSVEAAAANLRATVVRGVALGVQVAICDVLPWNNGWPDAEPSIRALNALVARIAHDERVALLPFHDTLEDPACRGRMKAEWTHADGDHPSVAGYRRLGEFAFRLPPS
ncbi:MAG: SGNH/GDSL hydrolase family protein [Acidobacteria bacterium]|nr:SGNH/GDSL hydrolase family protein [Acidobacteriota bacterium]